MEHHIYLSGLKRVLKARGVGYADLAAHLQMTESGVKKMMNAKDLSLRRVLQICERLDILPGHLFSLSEKTAIPEITFNHEQEDALIKSRHLLSVYWRFAIEKRALSEIENLQKVSSSELKKSLNRLVSLKLLKQSRGQYRVLQSGKFRWSDESKLAKHLNREWSELVLKRSLRATPNGLHRLAALRLKRETYRDLLKKISEIIDEAVQASEREELSTRVSDLVSATMLVAAVPKGVFDGD